MLAKVISTNTVLEKLVLISRDARKSRIFT